MNNIEEIINDLKSEIASDNLCGHDELTITVSDLSALIAQLEAAQKELSDLKFADYKLWHGAACNNHQKVLRLEAALSAANEKLSKPVVLPDDGLEDCINMWPDNWRNDFDTGYNFGIWRCEQNIKAAGFTVEGG
ncbi:hypothetical protein [Yersinia enterocolitica]|uniref:hypothetical protein n=1 Tax=Yersinia enterocolitica TaxID=630 RepID=UPI003D064FE6